jgi:hypothetical protein
MKAGVLYTLMVLFIPCVLDAPQGNRGEDPLSSISIVAVGDIMMGTTHPGDILPPDDGEGIFNGVAEEFDGADVVLGNLEGALVDNVRPTKCEVPLSGGCFEFVMPSRYARHLGKAGFNVMNIANNHILDAGETGAKSTIDTLVGAGIAAAGGERVASFQRSGRRIAVVGFSFKSSPYAHSILDVAGAREIVAALKADHDIIIVSFHGGAEGRYALHIPGRRDEIFLRENRGNVIKFARAVVDAGAHMVIGHGPHVVRAIEIYKGKLIAYSLGNFLTFGVFNLKGPNGISVILKARIDGKTGDFVEGMLIPVRLIDGGIPAVDPSGEAIDLIRDLTLKDMGSPTIVVDRTGTLRPLPQK